MTQQEINKIMSEYRAKQEEEIRVLRMRQREDFRTYMNPFYEERIRELNVLGVEVGDVIMRPNDGALIKVNSINYAPSGGDEYVDDAVMYSGYECTEQFTTIENRMTTWAYSTQAGLRIVKNREELMNK